MTRRTDRRPTKQDRAMVARREAGATRKAIAEEFGVPVSQVSGAEWLVRREKRGQELLAVDPEGLEGFHLIGDLEWRAWDTAYSLNYHFRENIVMERVGDLVGAGRTYFAERCTVRTMAMFDAFL